MRFIGGLLLAIGILIATVTGLCALTLIRDHPGTVLAYAALPMLVGVGLIFLGLALLNAGSGGPSDPGTM